MQLQEIAERCQQGDRKAFALLYTATRQQLRAVCLRYVQDETVADDVLHDTFLLIFSKIGELKDTKRTEAWLNMVARRMALLYLRQQKQQRQVPLSSCAATSLQSLTVENHGKSLLALSEILAAVDALPDGYRQVFRLSVLDGMTHQEIATLLNIEPHSSSSQLARAKQMLQRIISKYWVVLLLLFVPVGYWLMYRKNRSQLTGDSSRVIAVTDTTSSASSDEPTAFIHILLYLILEGFRSVNNGDGRSLSHIHLRSNDFTHPLGLVLFVLQKRLLSQQSPSSLHIIIGCLRHCIYQRIILCHSLYLHLLSLFQFFAKTIQFLNHQINECIAVTRHRFHESLHLTSVCSQFIYL